MKGMATRRRDEGRQPRKRHQKQDQIGGHHDEVAMGEVHQPHDAEDQAGRRKQRVEPAEQDPLDDGIDPDHAAAPK
jgi:hypothetical protein